MPYNLNKKIFQFSECHSVFSIIITIFKLIEIEKNSNNNIEDSYVDNLESKPIDYKFIPNSDDREISDLSYVQLSSAIFCALLYYKYESDFDSLCIAK